MRWTPIQLVPSKSSTKGRLVLSTLSGYSHIGWIICQWDSVPVIRERSTVPHCFYVIINGFNEERILVLVVYWFVCSYRVTLYRVANRIGVSYRIVSYRQSFRHGSQQRYSRHPRQKASWRSCRQWRQSYAGINHAQHLRGLFFIVSRTKDTMAAAEAMIAVRIVAGTVFGCRRSFWRATRIWILLLQ